MSNNSNNYAQPSALLLVHALTPVHAGTGQSAAVIDLPIAREKATGFPIVPGSSLKGVLRDRLSGSDKDWAKAVFGKEDRSGALCLTDLRTLCLPVRSIYGTFAYVTSPLVLGRLARDCEAVGVGAFADLPKMELPLAQSHLDAKVPTGSSMLISPTAKGTNANMFLEDLDLRAVEDDGATKVASAIASALFKGNEADFTGRFVVVPDTVFSFLCETATEVAARIRLEESTKTVTKGGLWFEEAVPAETLFYGLATVEPRFLPGGEQDPIAALEAIGAVQVGGDAGVGRGLCRLVVQK